VLSWPFARILGALALTALTAVCRYHPAPAQVHEVFDTVKAAHLTTNTRTPSPSVSHFDNLSAQLLNLGLGVRFRAPGTSMHPTIRHGDVITVEPAAPGNLRKGDIILCRLQRSLIAHRIVNIEEREGCEVTFILRGDASTTCDAPVKPEQVLGKVVCLERDHSTINPYSLGVKLWSRLYPWLARVKRSVFERFIRERHHKSPPFLKGDLGGFLGASEIPPDPPLVKGGN
jgi:signal peptidase